MKGFSQSILLFAMVVIGSLLISPYFLFAQHTTPINAVSETSTQRITKGIEQIREAGKELQDKINYAKKTLLMLNKELLPVGGVQEHTIKTFMEMQESLIDILDRLGSNSNLMDSVYRSRESAIVLQEWFKGKPSDYPRRDDSIKQLEATIQDLDKVAEKITESRIQAQNQLRAITHRHQLIIQKLHIGNFNLVEEDLKWMLGGLENVTQSLSGIASTIVSQQIGIGQ